MEPILITFWCTSGSLLEALLGLKSTPEGDQKWDQFWNPLPAAPRVGFGGRVVSPQPGSALAGGSPELEVYVDPPPSPSVLASFWEV